MIEAIAARQSHGDLRRFGLERMLIGAEKHECS